MNRVADSTAEFINENNLCEGKFEWQKSEAAFSISKSDVDKVCKYILNQPEHQRKKTFEDEYNEFIKYYQKTLKWDLQTSFNKVIMLPFAGNLTFATKVIRFVLSKL